MFLFVNCPKHCKIETLFNSIRCFTIDYNITPTGHLAPRREEEAEGKVEENNVSISVQSFHVFILLFTKFEINLNLFIFQFFFHS